jgi:predicted 3-demethylubiquinone-9 3-methyltransferase (glyoxalase superfamily)
MRSGPAPRLRVVHRIEEAPMQSINPCLWFDDRIEEAVDFYTSTLPGGKVDSVKRMPDGKVLVIEFEIAGQKLMALNGGPQFTFTEAISLVAHCDDQAETDHFWSVLTADGGEEGPCGWLKDKFGLSWQIAPVEFDELLMSSEGERFERAMNAMYGMKKLDIAALRAAIG